MSDDPWWNSSAGLKKNFPEIEKTPHWMRFAKSYDTPICREQRLKRWREANPSSEKSDGSLGQLEDLAMRATGRFSLTHLLTRSGEPVISKEKAGEGLGKIVLKLIGDPSTFEKLASEIRLRYEPPRKEKRIIADALAAFFQYLRREKRLPTNKQIRIEANRIMISEWFDAANGTTYEFGEPFEMRGNSYRVLSFCSDAEMVRAVYASRWEEERWDGPEFSRCITTPAGLGGLPKL